MGNITVKLQWLLQKETFGRRSICGLDAFFSLFQKCKAAPWGQGHTHIYMLYILYGKP